MKYHFNRILIATSFFVVLASCSSQSKIDTNKKNSATLDKKINTLKSIKESVFKTGADDWRIYLPILKEYKSIGIIANQSSIVNYNPNLNTDSEYFTEPTTHSMHLVDWLIDYKLNVTKIFAPEHGFRGTADAGELIKDGKDVQTGLPIVSLYGNNKKPKPEQLEGIDVLVFDLQDVGARFYTYISSLHYVMEACAENNITLIVLDRPNPNGNIIDGPILEKEYKSFVGMHEIPVLHGMTIGEYAKMINGEKWLNPSNGSGKEVKCDLKIVPCLNYSHDMNYSLPVRPSPNLPNDQSINLYASLCLFEGTNVSVGRGTEKQFQMYGSPFLKNFEFSFVPKPNFGSKEPLHNDKKCYGEDLSEIERVHQLELKWLIKAYENSTDKSIFFNSFFTKLAGTKKLQQQIENGVSEKEIRKSWENGLSEFKEIRKKYLIYE